MRETALWRDRRYCGVLWAVLIGAAFVGLSLPVLEYLRGTAWYFYSSALRLLFGLGILFLFRRLYGRDPLRPGERRTALIAASGFFFYLLWYLVTYCCGLGPVKGLTAGLFLSRVILQQLTTAFYEELCWRGLVLEGYFYQEKQTALCRLLYAAVSFLLFGALHVVTGWDLYTFFRTGCIGFAFAAIFLNSRSLLLPMLLHFLYDVAANMAVYIEWNGTPLFETLNGLIPAALCVMLAVSAVLLIRGDGNRKTAAA